MMKRTHDNHGFTVGELLIVVAIVALLVAIALPLFTSSLASAKESVDLANCRSARAAATTVCLIDHNGDFGEKPLAEWVQIALDAGIPRRSQVDSSNTLHCKLEESNTRITFFYAKDSDSGSGTTPDPAPTPDPDTSGGDNPGPTDPDPTPEGSIVVTKDGKTYATIEGLKWSETPTGTIKQYSVYSDNTGVYLFKQQTWLDPSSKSLDKVPEACRISDNPRLFTSSDIVNGAWVTAPKKGDLYESQGVYYLFTRDFGTQDIYPDGDRIRIDQKFVHPA